MRVDTSSADRLLRKCRSWEDFTAELSFAEFTKGKGDPFERLVQLYLQIEPKYTSRLKNVWLYNEVPTKVRQYLRLPKREKGVDLIAETRDGDYWSVQAKYRTDVKREIPYSELTSFTTFSFVVCKNISFGLICTTTNQVAREYEENPDKIGLATANVWEELGEEFFKSVRAKLSNHPARPKAYSPGRHQQKAVESAVEHFLKNRNTRGKLIHPCGSGKTLTAFWIAQELKAKTILIAVPSLSLIRQTFNSWLREYSALEKSPSWLCVCGDETAGKIDLELRQIYAAESGVPCITNVSEILRWLRQHNRGTRIVFTTYQSGKAIAAASRRCDFTFDLIIFDEAHKTVGAKDKIASHLLLEKNIHARRRVFMTATERRFRGMSNSVISMDDAQLFGETFDFLSFKRAIESTPQILSQYEIRVIGVGEKEIEDLIRQRAFVKPDRGSWKDIDAGTLAAVVGLRKAMQRLPIRHAVSFHRSIRRAEEFRAHNDSFSASLPGYRSIDTYHVSGKMSSGERHRELRDFLESKRSLITNSRCLTEGIDVPDIDAVIFADPKKSTVDIVQATGRALRPSQSKKKGYVIIPWLIAESSDLDALVDDNSFGKVLKVISALSSNDERIIEEFRALQNGRSKRGQITQWDKTVDEKIPSKIDLKVFSHEVSLRVWGKIGRLSWREFSEARNFVRSLNLTGMTQWWDWSTGRLEGSSARPADIPSNPQQIYEGNGWVNWGDWLGTGAPPRGSIQWMPFEEARDFARSLGLIKKTDWDAWVHGKIEGKSPRPDNIPMAPLMVYGKKKWRGWGDWLGTGTVAPGSIKWRNFRSARKFVRDLKMGRGNWRKWCDGDLTDKPSRPSDIPKAPWAAYASRGWVGMDDWLGTQSVKPGSVKFRAFRSARKFARDLELQTRTEWTEWCRGEMPGLPKKPIDIPRDPERVYKNRGWKGVADWLGTDTRSGRGPSGWMPFRSAREFVRSLGLKRAREWTDWCDGKISGKRKRPANIPKAPWSAYKNNGWKGFPDWLGTGSKKAAKKR